MVAYETKEEVDQFGLSWQIISKVSEELLSDGTEQELERVTKAFLQMKKFDIAALKKAENLYSKGI